MVSVEQILYIVPILALTASILYYAINVRNANKTQKMQLETRQVQMFMNISGVRSSPGKNFKQVTNKLVTDN